MNGVQMIAFCVDQNCPSCDFPEIGALCSCEAGEWPNKVSNYCRKCGWVDGSREATRLWFESFGLILPELIDGVGR